MTCISYLCSCSLRHVSIVFRRTAIGSSARSYTMSSRPKILICRNDAPQSALNILKNFDVETWKGRFMTREELLQNVKGKDAVMLSGPYRVDDEFLDAAGPQLKVVGTTSVGYDHIDMEAVRRRGIRVGNTPDVLTDAVAELTIGLLLSRTRRLAEGRDAVYAGTWPSHFPLFWMTGFGLKGSVVGIIGLGRIGFEIAKRLLPFKVKEILYASRNEKTYAAEVGARKMNLVDLLKESDIVIVICALTDETRNLLGEKEFSLMKKTAFVVNVARGAIIDQDALVRALQSGTIAGAALDVTTPEPLPTDHPLLKLPNCVIVPHLGSSDVATRTEMVELTAKNIAAALLGEKMPAELLCDTMSSRPKILICGNNFPSSALNLLKNFDVEILKGSFVPRDVLLTRIKGKAAVILCNLFKVDSEFVDAAGSQLKVVGTISVGYDHIDVEAVRRRGVRIGNTPNVLSDSVAELTIGLLLSCTRRIAEGRDSVRTDIWPTHSPSFVKTGFGLKDSVVGIIGLGRIGFEIAKRLLPFKVKEILYASRNEKTYAAEVGARKMNLTDLLKESDIVIVICALTDETRNLLGEKEFSMMKKTAFVVNVARGAIIDQDALVRALQSGTIAGAALDVTTPEPLPTDHPLLKLPNCVITPHLGWADKATGIAMAELTARNVAAGLVGEKMPAEVF